jgi:hypothetical protein
MKKPHEYVANNFAFRAALDRHVIGRGDAESVARVALTAAGFTRLREAFEALLAEYVAERDAFYDCVTNAYGEYDNDDDARSVAEMDAVIARARAALAAAGGAS